MGRMDEAVALLAAHVPDAMTDEQHALVAMELASGLFFALGRAEEANAVLADALGRCTSDEWRDELVAQHAELEMLAGHPHQAIERCAPSARPRRRTCCRRGRQCRWTRSRRRGSRSRRGGGRCQRHRCEEQAGMPGLTLRPRAASGRAGTRLGRSRRAERGSGRGDVILRRCGGGERRPATSMVVTRGRPRVADPRKACFGRPVLHRGRHALRRTAPDRRTTMVDRGMVDLSCDGGRCTNDERRQQCARCPSGRADAADGAEVERARAWHRHSIGDASGALQALWQSAQCADSSGSLSLVAAALHDIARLGDPASVVDRLGLVARGCQGDLVPARSAHARALADRDADALEPSPGGSREWVPGCSPRKRRPLPPESIVEPAGRGPQAPTHAGATHSSNGARARRRRPSSPRARRAS